MSNAIGECAEDGYLTWRVAYMTNCFASSTLLAASSWHASLPQNRNHRCVTVSSISHRVTCALAMGTRDGNNMCDSEASWEYGPAKLGKRVALDWDALRAPTCVILASRFTCFQDQGQRNGGRPAYFHQNHLQRAIRI